MVEKRGPTLYVPPWYTNKRVKEFAYCVRDKLNSIAGYERIHLKDYDQLEDGDVLIAMLDSDRSGEALFIKWNPEHTTVDDAVCAILRGDVPDVTDGWNDVEETIPEDER